MRQVNRDEVEAPAILSKRYDDDKTELDRLREAFQAGKELKFNRYKEDKVKQALDRLFHGKCAYCESFYAGTQPVDVEHYRPKGGVDGVDDHPGYWWLAGDWENLLPSCIDCNRKRRQKTPIAPGGQLVTLTEDGDFDRQRTLSTGKATAFPLDDGSPRASGETDSVDSEKRLLLDPTRENPDDDLIFHVDRNHLVSLVFPKPLDPADALALPPADDAGAVAAAANTAQVSTRGAVSIQVYGLNRLQLVQARTRVLRDLEFLLDMAISIGTLMEEVEDRRKRDAQTLSDMNGGGDPEIRAILEANQPLDKRLVKNLRQHRDALFDRMREMTANDAPYSAVAKAWVRAFHSS